MAVQAAKGKQAAKVKPRELVKACWLLPSDEIWPRISIIKNILPSVNISARLSWCNYIKTIRVDGIIIAMHQIHKMTMGRLQNCRGKSLISGLLRQAYSPWLVFWVDEWEWSVQGLIGGATSAVVRSARYTSVARAQLTDKDRDQICHIKTSRHRQPTNPGNPATLASDWDTNTPHNKPQNL